MPQKREQKTVKVEFIAFERIKAQPGAKTKIIKDFKLKSISSLNAILNNEDKLLENFAFNCPSDRLKLRQSKFPELNNALYEWFIRMRAERVEISGELPSSQAKLIAQQKGYTEFKASHGYIDKFKGRFGIKFRKFHGQGISGSDCGR